MKAELDTDCSVCLDGGVPTREVSGTITCSAKAEHRLEERQFIHALLPSHHTLQSEPLSILTQTGLQRSHCGTSFVCLFFCIKHYFSCWQQALNYISPKRHWATWQNQRERVLKILSIICLCSSKAFLVNTTFYAIVSKHLIRPI